MSTGGIGRPGMTHMGNYGALAPGRDPIKTMTATNGRCACTRAWLHVCGAPATGVLSIGCVHEHLVTSPVCDSCLAEARRAMAVHNFWCEFCEKSREPHPCPASELCWIPA